eukprot:gene5400-7147_t
MPAVAWAAYVITCPLPVGRMYGCCAFALGKHRSHSDHLVGGALVLQCPGGKRMMMSQWRYGPAQVRFGGPYLVWVAGTQGPVEWYGQQNVPMYLEAKRYRRRGLREGKCILRVGQWASSVWAYSVFAL